MVIGEIKIKKIVNKIRNKKINKKSVKYNKKSIVLISQGVLSI